MEERLTQFIENIGLRAHVDKLRYKRGRRAIWDETRHIRIDLHEAIQREVEKAALLQRLTGLALTDFQPPPGVRIGRQGLPTFAVTGLREARRQRDDGRALNQVFVTLVQKQTMEHMGLTHTIRSGSTLVLDLDETRVSYVVRKGLRDKERVTRTIRFKEDLTNSASLAATYFGESREPFAALHHLGA